MKLNLSVAWFPGRVANFVTISLLVLCASIHAEAQVTSFTFQGRLSDNGAPANGLYDLRFSLFSTNLNGSPLVGPLTNSAVQANNGLFSAILDFGASVFDGTPRWLEIGVRTNGSVTAYTPLSPRYLVNATPYAITAATISGPLPDARLSTNVALLNSSVTFSGSVSFAGAPPFAVNSTNRVVNLDADLLDGLDASAFLSSRGGVLSGALTNNSGTNVDAIFTEGAIDRPATNSQVFAVTNSGSGAMTLQVKNEMRVGAGSATVPSISFLANTNTGAFNPVANALAFSTAGAERLRISTNGNVGIGTVPGNSARLEVAGNASINGMLSLSTSIVSPGVDSTISPATSVVLLNPATFVTLSSTTPIAAPAAPGTLLMLIGTSDVNTVSVPDSGNVHLSGNRVLGDGDTLTLIYTGSIWVEIGYANN
jgi:hypothetical protein